MAGRLSPLASPSDGQRIRYRADAAVVGRAIADEAALGPVPQGEQRLARQVRARVAGHADVIEVGGGDAGHLEARPHRVVREARDMLDAAEPLLFHRGHELAVAHEHGETPVVGRDTRCSLEWSGSYRIGSFTSRPCRRCGPPRAIAARGVDVHEQPIQKPGST